jgi:ribosomal RNA-processing protein 36
MPLSSKLDRKLQALEESTDDEEYYEVTDRSTSPSLIDTGGNGDGVEVLSSEDEEEGLEEENEDAGDDVVQAQMSQVSFGALAKAQDAISKQQSTDRKRKRGDETSKSQDDKLQVLRQRLQEIKAARMAQDAHDPPSKKAKTSKTKTARTKASKDTDEDDDSSESDAAPRARSSKHAPAVQSSKKAVSRKRKVVDVKKSNARDPRFGTVSGPQPDENAIKKRYAFLDDYKKSEMGELRDAIKKTKNETDKEKLKKKLMSMESQLKTQERKDKLQEVAREHKKKEKELVKDGKKPFFLKKSDQKQLALVDRFQKMKPKDRDHAIERRRKKATAKERKNMPDERRTA